MDAQKLKHEQSELPSSTQRHRRESTTRFYGAVLWLAGCLVTWVRPWDAPFARFRACSSMLGCRDTMVITIADALQSKMEQVGGCHKLEGLLQCC